MSTVFDPSRIGTIPLKNRILRSATVESLADASGRPQDALQERYVALAAGGVGAIITSMTGVDPGGKGAPFMNMIHRDDLIESYRRITSAVHAHNTPIVLQLAHAGRQTKASITGAQPVAPSALRDRMFPKDKPRALTEPEIWDLIEKFVSAIDRAAQAGFDGVQLHAAHGFLLAQFLSRATNRRRDCWGGTTKNRARILDEILRGARRRVGDFPIWAKINAADGRRSGMRVSEAVEIAKLLEAAGCDAIEVSRGVGEDGWNTIRVRERPIDAMLRFVPELRALPGLARAAFRISAPVIIKVHEPLSSYNVSAAAQIKSHLQIPVIVVGGTRALSDIEQIIATRQADYVALARPFIIEPDIVNRFKAGRQKRSRCLSCGYCALGSIERPTRCHFGKIADL